MPSTRNRPGDALGHVGRPPTEQPRPGGTAASGAAPGEDPSEIDLALRVGIAWRELRRLSSSQALRDRIRGDGPELDLGQADALAAAALLGTARMGELADALRVDASTATRAVDRLVEAGLVRRDRDPEDRRVVVIAPTDEGVALHERWKARGRRVMGEILDQLPERDRARLAVLMERLVAAADGYLSEPAAVAGDGAQPAG